MNDVCKFLLMHSNGEDFGLGSCASGCGREHLPNRQGPGHPRQILSESQVGRIDMKGKVGHKKA